MLRPYPDTLPPEAWAAAAGLLRGQYPEKAKALHIALETASYAAGRFLPDNGTPVVLENSQAPEPTREELAKELDALATSGHKAFQFNFAALLKAMLEIAVLLLQQA